jgi:hypothetical protein
VIPELETEVAPVEAEGLAESPEYEAFNDEF